jgi:hypothetical protein
MTDPCAHAYQDNHEQDRLVGKELQNWAHGNVLSQWRLEGARRAPDTLLAQDNVAGRAAVRTHRGQAGTLHLVRFALAVVPGVRAG